MTEELLRMVANRIDDLYADLAHLDRVVVNRMDDLYADLAYLDRDASFRVPLKRQLREAFAMKAALLARQSAEG